MHSGFPMGAGIALVVYLVILWAGFRWALSIVNRLARATASELETMGVKILAQRPSRSIWKSAEVDIEHDSQKAKVSVRQWGRDSQLVSVSIEAPPMPAIWIRRERAVDRLAKAMHLEREVQLGVPEMDAALYISSSASDETVREVLSNAETLRLVREILGYGFSVTLSREGLRATTIKYFFWHYDGTAIPQVLARLKQLATTLPKMSESLAGDARMPVMTIAVIIPAILCVFVPMLLMVGGVRESIHPPIENSAVGLAFAMGLLAWFPAVYLASRMIRHRPLALLELAVAAFALLASVPVTVASGIMWVNSHFDHSAAVRHRAHVVDYYRHNSHTVYVEPWGAAGSRQKVIVPYAIASVQIGDTFDIESHSGALGWTWVSDIRRVE